MIPHHPPVAVPDDSLAMDFPAVERRSLANAAGLSYSEFRNSLTPRHGLGWILLLSGHAALLFILWAMAMALRAQAPILAVVAPGALALGYAIAYIQLFFHEAAHYNIAGDRALNDLLANVLIGSLTGQDIRRYRLVHFEHHRKLGTPEDTEISYFDPLNMRFLTEGLCAIKALRIFVLRDACLRTQSAQSYANFQLGIGIVVNGLFLAGCLAAGLWPLSLAWALGVVAVYPFLNALRQTLEHRGEHAQPREDYRRKAHGAVNRIFGDGPVSDTFGGAGFNRHLLHHWEPQVPFTRLKELETYLRDTPFAEHLLQRTTSYPKAFAKLWSWNP